jgi:hypothetical protein
MASTDSTIPDTSTGDSTGALGGQSFTEKAKSAVKGNIPVCAATTTSPSILNAWFIKPS